MGPQYNVWASSFDRRACSAAQLTYAHSPLLLRAQAKCSRENYLSHTQVKRAGRAQGPSSGRPRARTGRTQPVVDARGHLLPGVPRRSTAFVLCDDVWQHSSARWPQARRLVSYAIHGALGIQKEDYSAAPDHWTWVFTISA